MIDRRGFLRTLLSAGVGAVAGFTLDPERLLWVPGAKTIFLPPPPQVCRCGLPITHGSELTPAEFQRRFIEPAVKAMADKIDADIVRMYGRHA